jgi:hypothetical protein
MNASSMQCHGCGSTNVTFDPKRRILICNQCGKQEYYSRATLNTNKSVVYARQNAINFFTQGNYDTARQYAQEILNISVDNAPAVYIIAFYDEFSLGRNGSLKRMFALLDSMALEYQEVVDLMELFISAPGKLIEYQEEVITTIAKNMQDEKDAQSLCTFFDKICPFFIAKWPSMGFLKPSLVELYIELADHCGIPKTCFALLNAIQKNPDSPYANNTFFLKPKTEYFYEHFVLPVGRVVEAMKDKQYRIKFLAAFEQRKEQYERDSQ